MTSAFPAVRARSTQDTLAYLDAFRPGLRAEVERRLPPEVRETIATTLGSAWIHIDVDAAMAREILAVLGREEATRFFTRFISHHLDDSPVLAGPVRTAFSLLGITPASLVKWMPRIIAGTYRDLVEIRIDVLEPARAAYHYDVLSEVFFAEPVYAHVIEGTAHALMGVAGTRGEVRVARDAKARRYDVEMTWRTVG